MDLIRYFKSRQSEMISFLKELVSLESPSADKEAVNRCSSFVIKELKKIGAKAAQISQEKIGDLHIVEYPRPVSKERKEQILILTHVDTVWPVGRIKEMPFYISENKVFGPGVLDMKAGLVMSVYSLKTLHDLNLQPKKKITIFMNSAEEVGSEASYEIIRNLAKKSACVLCLEPALPGGGLKIQRKGRLVIHLLARGKAAHAGTPEKGINAIQELMLQIRILQKLQTKETTINLGLIQGGEKANIVAEEASATLDIRFWENLTKDKIISHLKQLTPILSGARIKYSIESFTPPMEYTLASKNLFSRVQEIAVSLGMTLGTGKTGGGSDASIASHLGVPTLDGLGPEGEGIHAENEHLLLSSLVERTALFTEILRQL